MNSRDRKLAESSELITLVSGCPDESSCGVYDYSGKLAEALIEAGVAAIVNNAKDWSIGGIVRMNLALRRSSVIHIQYPSLAFENKKAPYFAFFGLLLKSKVVTFHEFSTKSQIGKILSMPLLMLANSIIVTSRQEAEAIKSVYKFARRKLSIIPIGSNICEAIVPGKCFDVVYFGQIRANKGIEQYLDILEAMPHLSAAFLGGFASDDDAECRLLVERARSVGALVKINEENKTIARFIASSRLAVLPFPDGLTERRGSALAAMINRTLVVSTRAKGGHSQFDDLAELVDDVSEMPAAISSALANMNAHKNKIERAYTYSRDRSWSAIAQEHLSIYRAIMKKKPRGTAVPAN